eukprot:Selendium_serpulae@DN4155_c0_g1_i1.p1
MKSGAAQTPVGDHPRTSREMTPNPVGHQLRGQRMSVFGSKNTAHVDLATPSISSSLLTKDPGLWSQRCFYPLNPVVRETPSGKSSCDNTGHQALSWRNGVAERAIRTITDMVRAALLGSALQAEFWRET